MIPQGNAGRERLFLVHARMNCEYPKKPGKIPTPNELFWSHLSKYACAQTFLSIE